MPPGGGAKGPIGAPKAPGLVLSKRAMDVMAGAGNALSAEVKRALSINRQQDCGPEPKTRGYNTSNIQGAHTSYVRDGIYIKAATCFIQKNFKKG
jgi:hypothetical protein